MYTERIFVGIAYSFLSYILIQSESERTEYMLIYPTTNEHYDLNLYTNNK